MTGGASHEPSESLDNLLHQLNRALEATSTRDMSDAAGRAQALAVALDHYLEAIMDGSRPAPAGADSETLRIAEFELSQAVVRGEAVGLATDLPSMRVRVEEFQERVETVLPYLRCIFGPAEA